MIQLPRLLTASMEPRCDLRPESVSISQNLYDLHTANVVLPPGEPDVKSRDWMMLFDANGKVGAFRVSRQRAAYGRRTELTLKHGFCVLGDDVVKESGGKLTGTAEDIIRALWQKTGVDVSPTFWQLGSFAKTPEITYEYNNPRLLDAVFEVLKKVPGYAFSFDESAFPWTFGLVRLSDEDACEGRFGRNLDSCTVDVDDSAFCSRVYLDDRDGFTDADTINTWGICSRVLTVPESADKSDVAAYVAAYLNDNKEPRVTITLSGEDMSLATGEAIDSFALGRVCRGCLPEYGATVRERIITRTTPDVYGDPHAVLLSMANKADNVSNWLDRLRKNTSSLKDQSLVTGRRVGGVSAKADQTYWDLILTKEEVTDTRARMSRAGIAIDTDLAMVKLLASQETVDLVKGEVDKASAELLVQAGLISTKVELNGVISAINQTAEEILIQARRINLSGYVTISTFEAEMAIIDNIFAGYSEISALGINGNLYAKHASFTDTVRIYQHTTEWASKTVQTSIPEFTKATVTLANGNSISVVTGWKTAPSEHRSTMNYLSY